MEIKLINVKKTLEPQGLNPELNNDMNAITDKLLIHIPYLQGWMYDPELDSIIMQVPLVIPSSISEVGEVVEDDFIIG